MTRGRFRPHGGPAGAVAGLTAGAVAGAVSGGPSTAWALLRSEDPLAAAVAAGSLLLPSELRRPRLLVAAALAHTVLSLGWAAAMSAAWPRRQESVTAACVRGCAYGVLIAAADLGAAHASTNRRLSGVRALPVGPQIADHVAYGAVVGALLHRRQTRSMASAIESSTRPGR